MIKNAKSKLLLLCVVMVCILSLPGCTTENKTVKQPEKVSEYGIPAPIEGISWGMTRDEALKVLDGKKYTAKEDPDSASSERITFEEPLKAFGKDAKVIMEIIHNKKYYEDGWYPNLDAELVFGFELEFSKEDGEAVHEQIKSLYGEGTADPFGLPDNYWYYSKEKIKDLKNEELEKAFVDLIVKRDRESDTGSTEEERIAIEEEILSRSLNSLNIAWNEDHYIVRIFAGHMLDIESVKAGK